MSAPRRFRRGGGRRYLYLGTTVAVAAVFAIFFVAASGAGLSTSPFEGADGNMIVDTAGNTDWCTDFPPPASGTTCAAPIPNLRTLVDVPSGTSDNSFTQGSKEDDPNVVIAQGSIPPNKNDLTRAYAATQAISGETFLYLAWERQPNPLGSANIDFELDQNASQGDFTQPGSLTINRTEGDILITYDFGGSGTPDLGLLTWLTPGNGHSDSDCEASGQTLPCWGDRIDLNPQSSPPAESAVNAATIDEVFTGDQLDAGSFGEAKIDLSTVPGLFTEDQCTDFGSMFVKSRSSGSSIDAELKDFIAPAPVHVSNCESPTISTSLSETTGSVGDSVHDSATLDGATTDAGGTVTYSVYTDSACTQGQQDAGTVDVTDGSVPDSNPIEFDQAGTFYWQAVYSGDNHNNGATSPCTDEQLVINPAAIQIVKTADAAKVNVGSPIGFTLTVSNSGAGDARGVKLSDTLPTNAGLSWSIASQGAGWGSSCSIAAGVLSCGGANGVTVPAGTTQAHSTFTVHIVSGTTAATGGDCPSSGVVDNTGSVTTSNDGSDQSSASTCVQALVDLSVTKTGAPNPLTLGQGNITWTIVVKNNGPDADTGVTIADPMPAGNTFVSATSTQGSCTGGAILRCNIGAMAAGASVTITLVTTPSATGDQVNTVTVAGSRPETNTGNNSATATVLVVGPAKPPVFCVAVSKVTPKQLFVGRKTKLTIRVTQHGAAVKGVHVQIKGPKFSKRTAASNSKGVITQSVKLKKAGILVFSPIASKRCNTKRVGVTGVFTPPVTG